MFVCYALYLLLSQLLTGRWHQATTQNALVDSTVACAAREAELVSITQSIAALKQQTFTAKDIDALVYACRDCRDCMSYSHYFS